MINKDYWTMEDAEYFADSVFPLIQIVENYPISMEQIVKIAELCGKIAQQGKLGVYIRILFDGAKDD